MRFQQISQNEQELLLMQKEIEAVLSAILESRKGRPSPVLHCRTPLGTRLRAALNI